MLMLPQTLMHAVADYLWYPVALSFGGASLLMVGIDAWKTKNVESQLLTASGLFIIPYAIHDLLLVHAVLPWEHGYYIQFGAVILLAMFAAILLYRLVRFNNEAELLNENLEQQVDIKTAQVKDALQRNRELEKKQWLSAERARITRDMHDGVAGQIISTIKSLEYGNIDSQQIHEQLEYCLNDIRLMVDSLDNEENDLLNLLGMFRYRIEPMLQTAGIQLKWNPLPLDTNIELTPSKSLHILRILQEAVHNTIRHANCSQLKITAVLVNGGRVLEITVSDNGQNVASNQLSLETKSKKTKTRASGERMNRGIRNMHHRAELIGATLKIHFNQAGTTLELLVPLPEEPEDTKSV
jgi:signal transduction histidine kinase